jgi:hypothetical protein
LQERFVAGSDARVDDANRALFYLWVSNQVERGPTTPSCGRCFALPSLVAAFVFFRFAFSAPYYYYFIFLKRNEFGEVFPSVLLTVGCSPPFFLFSSCNQPTN